ncbi:hypothetical protein K491DRAFT_480911 [Lophiostoma macrostomum CBS 122681]|uniref:Uncharacterized protein n=1 Tax=Lophiostoma macrostomum CBS 122681 TaxID=1314788 RepID=A0A6A6TQK2_9PLEO|nr:hypothetical protein K491DRAFT_480911 [Lophiostoma macrostomum CBS 122681]
MCYMLFISWLFGISPQMIITHARPTNHSTLTPLPSCLPKNPSTLNLTIPQSSVFPRILDNPSFPTPRFPLSPKCKKCENIQDRASLPSRQNSRCAFAQIAGTCIVVV